jgi:hypothetical protein
MRVLVGASRLFAETPARDEASGASVWALSPLLTGHAEPWDADGPYYLSALAIAGAISGSLAPKSLWAQYVAAVVGQAAFEIVFLGVGPLFILGLLFLAGSSLVFLAAAALGAFVRVRCTEDADAA